MTHLPSQNDIVNTYLKTLPENIAPLFSKICLCILEAGPSFNESIKWKDCLVYGAKKNHIQTVVGKDKISLIVINCVSLLDDFGLLEGDGKKTRTMRITSLEFNQEALRCYVQQTLQLDKQFLQETRYRK